MRKCYRCGANKRLNEFSWRNKARGQRDSFCRACRSEYGKEHYRANRQRYIDQAARLKRKIVRERWIYLLGYFVEHPCADCGESDPLVLEFDHVGTKSFSIGAALRDRNWQSILDEIEECEVVCANCHRRRTASRAGFARAVFAGEARTRKEGGAGA